MKCKKIIALLLSLSILFVAFTGCSYSDIPSSNTIAKAALITDTGGLFDQSFNQLSWEGLNLLKNNHNNIELSYLEPMQESDFITGIDSLCDNGNDLIVTSGAPLTDATVTSALLNPKKKFLLCDCTVDEIPSNLTTITFRQEESAFLVGYIAGKTTQSNKVGFVGGMDNLGAYSYQNGYMAGVKYAANELGKDIEVVFQYAESYSDMSKGRAIAKKFYAGGCDIIFQCAGAAGLGVIEEAKSCGKYVIGVDKDQYNVAPDNILTSALKNIDKAILNITERIYNGENLGGQNFEFGLTDGITGIPEENPNLNPEVYNSAMEVQEKIKNKSIVIPTNKESYDNYCETITGEVK